jgi:hypothetical protein
MNNRRRTALKLASQLGLLGSAAALHQPQAKAKQSMLSFCAIGDTPYIGSDTSALRQTFQDAVLQDCKFITHIGDIKSSWDPCSNELLRERIALLNESSLPLFYVPGDNEWVDCGRGILNSYNPEERLEFLRSIASKGNVSLGKKPLTLERQATLVNAQALPENIRWMHSQCAFIGLHVTGSFNGIGTDGIDEKKRLEREKANALWMNNAAQWAEENNARALVLLAHANVSMDLGVDSERLSKKRRQAFTPFKQSLDQLLTQWKKPLLYIHGDTHRFQVNNPWSELHPHLTRLEVFGAPFTNHWVKVSIDMDAQKPQFQIAPISLMKNDR